MCFESIAPQHGSFERIPPKASFKKKPPQIQFLKTAVYPVWVRNTLGEGTTGF